MTQHKIPPVFQALLILCMAFTFYRATGTAEAGGKQINSINTSVIYLDRMMLPPGSTVTVTLSDVSKMDTKALELASETVQAEGGPPYQLSLNYDADVIDDRMRYSLRGVIENSGKLLYTSTETIDPFRDSAGDPVEIIVRPVQSTTESSPSVQDLNNTEWKLFSLRGNAAGSGAGGQKVSLSFSADGSSVMGFSGCNTYRGSVESSRNKLKFGPLATTMKMCIDTKHMELEQSFQRALEEVQRYDIAGNELTLLDAHDNPLVILRSE